ncbi:NYN domain-containing protein [Eggerthellaceae bacterium 24-137]
MELKTPGETSDKRFALLIDADNVSARYIKPILNELSKYGTVTIKRIYGDWTLTLHAKWKDALLENSITPIQQFGYTQGKNATDSAMIIDAMDILYTDNVDGFCLVSSDSDFTRLASRLRESGRTVIGMGEKKTPVPFRRACDVFTTLELLVQNKRERSGSGSGNGGSAVPKDAVEQAVVDIITDNQNNGKSTGLGEIGSRLQKRYPDFDVRSYGTNLLSKLLEEFTRVTITKDHSSVTVELADGAEEKSEKAEKPERSEKKSRNDKEPKADGKAEAAASADQDQESSGAEEPEAVGKASRRGRSHRGTRRVTPKVAGHLAEGSEQAVAALPEPVAEQADAAAVEPVVAAAEKADAPRDVRPGRKARAARKAQAGVEAEEGQQDTAVEHDAAPEKPAQPEKPKRSRKKPAATAPDTAGAIDTPQAYIRQMVKEAGADGIMLSTITDRLRARFKDFKVRDLGFSQMRQYMASTGEYDLEKSGRNFRVRLA